MGEQWITVEEIREARELFEAAIPGWDKWPPYGVGRLNDDGSVEFVRVDNGDHALPGVVLATVCGHVTGSASYVLAKADLARAIELLAPAPGAGWSLPARIVTGGKYATSRSCSSACAGCRTGRSRERCYSADGAAMSSSAPTATCCPKTS
jgi:hypothetical protein